MTEKKKSNFIIFKSFLYKNNTKDWVDFEDDEIEASPP